MSENKAARPTNLGVVLKKYRVMTEIDLRELAASFGISAATLLRIETGEAMPTGDTLMKIFNWLMARAI